MIFPKFLHDACRTLILRLRKKKKENALVLLQKSSRIIFPGPEATKKKIGFCFDFGRFAEFSKLSEPQFEIPKSHMKLMNFSYEKINTPKVKATKTMPKSMLFH